MRDPFNDPDWVSGEDFGMEYFVWYEMNPFDWLLHLVSFTLEVIK